jgi:hypothetical protein
MLHKRSRRGALLTALVPAALLAGLGLAQRPPTGRAPGPLSVNPPPIATDKTVKYDYDIVYVRGTRKGDDTVVHWPEVFGPFNMEPGADLMLLHPDGREELLVSGAGGSVTDPFVSFDGEWVYYSQFHNPKPLPPNFRGVGYTGSDVCKIHVKTRKVVALTHQEFTPKTGVVASDNRRPPVFNLGPCPVPGHKVIFTSNRNGFVPTKDYTQAAMQLFLMDDDGGNVEEVGFLNLGSALHPTILRDGRVMFSSYESQGLRNLRNWGLWSINPDGTNWGPLVSSFSMAQVFHFQTQLSDGPIVVEEYYNGNTQGFGTYLAIPEPGRARDYPAFADALSGGGATADGFLGPYALATANGGMPFIPLGLVRLTPFSHPGDSPAFLSDPKDPRSPRMGRVTHPCAAPDNNLLTTWTPGPGTSHTTPNRPAIDTGIYLLKAGRPVREPGQMLLIKNDPRYNEQWPRALVPYKRIHGVDEPPVLPFANAGQLSRHLPEGTPFGLVGTSSLYKRESYPRGKVRKGSVTATFAGNKADPYEGQGPLCYDPGVENWFYQGSEAGRYGNADVHAIRIVAFEPTTDWRRLPGGKRTFWNMVNERMRILGEIPVRHFPLTPNRAPPRGEGNQISPLPSGERGRGEGGQRLDPDGNPDTSFLARIPADVPFTFQMLDRDGMVLTTAQTWHQLRPGEVRTDCGGCHAHSQKPTQFRDTAAARADYPVWDLFCRTPLLTTKQEDQSGKKWDANDETGVRFVRGPLNVEYYRDVKPILDRSCAACHTGKSGRPAGNLVLDDDRLMDGPPTFDGTDNGTHAKVPGTFFRLALDMRARFGPRPPFAHYGLPQVSRYVRLFQSRRSLLIWKIFGRRLDGWKNEDFACEKVPGDARSLQYKGKPYRLGVDGDGRRVGLAYTGGIMPPPEAVAGTYERDGKRIKVAPLTPEDRLTLVRWIDLGSPIDFDYDPARPGAPGRGWMCDETRPTLTLTYPRPGANPPLTRLLVGMSDYYTGLDLGSFRVTADFAVDGIAAGQNLAPKFRTKAPGVWELTLSRPLARLDRGQIVVSVRDRQGNVTRIERTFSAKAAGPVSR